MLSADMPHSSIRGEKDEIEAARACHACRVYSDWCCHFLNALGLYAVAGRDAWISLIITGVVTQLATLPYACGLFTTMGGVLKTY